MPAVRTRLHCTRVHRTHVHRDHVGVRVSSDAPDQSTQIDLRDGAKVRVGIPEAR
jgi:hypothetical protein